ncbi:hypothetical protein Tco_1105436 [Tanacetum coccineum]
MQDVTYPKENVSGSGADKGTGVTPGVPDAPDYDSEHFKSVFGYFSSFLKDDEDDDVHDDDENAQDDDDEEQTESEDDGDDFIHPKLTTHDDEIIHEEETDEDDTFDPIVHTPSHISSSDDEDSDNDVEGTNVEGAKSDEDATYEEDQGNEAVEDTNTNLEGRDDVMTDVILPQVQATQEIEDTHVTLTPVNPDGQQQSSSVSSGFVSNMLNPNQDTGVDDIFEQHAEATSLIDTPVTAIVEPSFSAPTNRPPTPNPLVIQIQQPPILTPATTTSSSLQNLPNFASLFGFDYRLKALEDNFSELRQTNQYAEALSSIPGIVDHYLANKVQEAVDVAVQLKYERIREESNTENQQFLDSIDEGMKKVIKEQVKKEVSKITPKIEKLVIEQLESEVLVRSSKEANTSHAVAANLSELELKKILIDKMEANNSINRSDIQMQLYKALVDAYEADKILLDTYGDTVTLKRPRDGADDDHKKLNLTKPDTYRSNLRRRDAYTPYSDPRRFIYENKDKKNILMRIDELHKFSDGTLPPVEKTMQTTDVFEAPAHQEFETGVHDEQAEEEVQHLPDWFQQPTRLPSPGIMSNGISLFLAVHESCPTPLLSNLAQQDPRESFRCNYPTLHLTSPLCDVSSKCSTQTPELLACPTFELMKMHLQDQNTTNSPSGESHIGAKSEDSSIHLSTVPWKSARDVYSKDGLIVDTKKLKKRCHPKACCEGSSIGDESYQRRFNPQTDTYRINLRRPTLIHHTLIQEDSSARTKTKEQIDVRIYKAVRLRYSDPMIQPELEGSTQGYPLVSVEVLSHGPSDAMHKPLPATQSQKDFVSKLTEIHSFLLTLSLRNIRVNSFTMKMEILLEPTSNKLMVEDSLKLNLSITEKVDSHKNRKAIFKMVVECQVLKLKNFKKDATLKLFKNGMRMSVQKSQVHKMAKRVCLVDDLKMLKITMSKNKFKEQAQSKKLMISYRQIDTRESKSADLKTKDKA